MKNIITFMTIVSCIFCIHLVIAESTKHVFALLDFIRRIDEVEKVIVLLNFEGAWNVSTSIVNQDFADTT
jgi:hypothetical protein